MQDIRGNDIIKWVTVILDWSLACCLLPVFDEVFPQYATSSAMNGTKSEMMVLLMSIVIATYMFPTVIHRRKMMLGMMMRRNALLVLTTMVLFVFTCRMMSTSGNYIVFGVVYGVILWISIMTLRIVERATINSFRSKGWNSRTVLFLGNDPANLAVYKELMSDPATGYRVLGYYSDYVIRNKNRLANRYSYEKPQRVHFRIVLDKIIYREIVFGHIAVRTGYHIVLET